MPALHTYFNLDTEADKSPFLKGGFRGIFKWLYKIPHPPPTRLRGARDQGPGVSRKNLFFLIPDPWPLIPQQEISVPGFQPVGNPSTNRGPRGPTYPSPWPRLRSSGPPCTAVG